MIFLTVYDFENFLRKDFFFLSGETVFHFSGFFGFFQNLRNLKLEKTERGEREERDVQVTEMSTYRCIGEIERYVFFIIFTFS